MSQTLKHRLTFGSLLLSTAIWAPFLLVQLVTANAISSAARTPVIRLIAGGAGGAPFAGNGGPARLAVVTRPGAVSADGQGNVLFTDNAGAGPNSLNCEVREVAKGTGKLRVVAGRPGNGAAPSKSARSALQVRLNGCSGLSSDRRGAAFVLFGQGLVAKIKLSDRTIQVVAGGGQANHLGDGGAAVDAFLYGPEGLAVDGHGNLYIADTLHNRIRKVSRDGIITTVAGNGIRGFAGDGAKATAARLALPQDISVDNQGNLFIADYGNNRVREVVARRHVIHTIAGGGICALKPAFCGEGVVATRAGLKGVHSVAVDAQGNVFVGANHLVLKVNQSNGRIYRVAGNGKLPIAASAMKKQRRTLAALRAEVSPLSLATAGSNVFIADDWSDLIRELAV